MTNDKQQTAVEWCAGRHHDLEGLRDFGAISIVEYYEELTKAVQQAKKMEKQQIIKAYHQGVTDEYGDALEFGDNTDGEVYYNEIYGNK
jgi:hypothetical protein